NGSLSLLSRFHFHSFLLFPREFLLSAFFLTDIITPEAGSLTDPQSLHRESGSGSGRSSSRCPPRDLPGSERSASTQRGRTPAPQETPGSGWGHSRPLAPAG